MPPVPALRPTRRAIAAAQPSLAPRASLPTRVWRAVRAAVQPSGGGRIITTSAELARELRAGWETDSGVEVNSSSSMRVATIYRCVSIIADTMGMLPWRVYRRDGDKKTLEPGHPVDVLLARTPNRWQDPFQFKRWIGVCQCLRGNAYVLKAMRAGEISELIPLHPDHMAVEQIGDFDVRYLYTTWDGRRVVFSSSEILHFRALSLNGLWGLSPIEAARQAVGLSLAAEKFGARFFGKGVRPTGVIKLPPGSKLNEEQIKRLREDIQSALGGIDNSHKVALLEEGMEWQNISMTAVEAQYIEARQFQSDELCQFFGVPPFMVGNTQKSTSWGTGLDNQRIGFVIHTMMPRLISAQDTANAALFVPGDEDDLFTQFQTESLTLPDVSTLANSSKTLIEAGVISPNEARLWFNLNPRTDQAGDDFVIPGNKGIDSKAAAQPNSSGGQTNA
jgi:HK97 family phage portal protein